MKIQKMRVLSIVLLTMLTMLAAWGVPAQAEEASFGKLFLTPKQRAAIDQQRQAYLNRNSAQPSESTLKKTSEKHEKSARLGVPLALSSIITTPDGQLFRLNGKYVKYSKSGYHVKQNPQALHSAEVGVKGREIHLKVGETYVPAKDKKVKSYSLVPNKKQEPRESLKLNQAKGSSPTSTEEQQMDLSAQIKDLQRLTELTK